MDKVISSMFQYLSVMNHRGKLTSYQSKVFKSLMGYRRIGKTMTSKQYQLLSDIVSEVYYKSVENES